MSLPAATKPTARYGQCGPTCTTDCGHCKGAGAPAAQEQVAPVPAWQTTYVSYSELAAFRQCPLKWRLSYRDRWSSDRAKPALDRGTVFDAMMQTHYAAQMGEYPMEERRPRVAEVLGQSGLAEQEDRELLEWMYEGYLEHYDTDPQEWEVLANQYAAVLPLPDPDDPTKDGPIGLKVKIDRVAKLRSTNQIWIWDDKTGKEFPKPAGLDIDDQFKLYTWQLRFTGRRVAGFMVNHARTSRLKRPQTMDERFRRFKLFATDTELANVALDAARAAREIHNPGRVEFASPNSGLGGCSGWCDYFDAHLAIRRGQSEESALRAFGYEKRPPSQSVGARGAGRSDKVE